MFEYKMSAESKAEKGGAEVKMWNVLISQVWACFAAFVDYRSVKGSRLADEIVKEKGLLGDVRYVNLQWIRLTLCRAGLLHSRSCFHRYCLVHQKTRRNFEDTFLKDFGRSSSQILSTEEKTMTKKLWTHLRMNQTRQLKRLRKRERRTSSS